MIYHNKFQAHIHSRRPLSLSLPSENAIRPNSQLVKSKS